MRSDKKLVVADGVLLRDCWRVLGGLVLGDKTQPHKTAFVHSDGHGVRTRYLSACCTH
jgi:hypothetical protein